MKSEVSFLTNVTEPTFLEALIKNIESSDEFSFSVSFIKKAGLKFLIPAIEKALNRGVKGTLITSTYQNFTDVPSLETFLEWQKLYPNFKCHLDFDSFEPRGYHSKGYLFKKGDKKTLLIGSSNITYFALKENIEWNLSYEVYEDAEVIKAVEEEFTYLFSKTKPLTQELIDNYRLRLEVAIEKWDMDYLFFSSDEVKPNLMQVEALKSIARVRDEGEKRCLVVASTGSGKTYLAAFDAMSFQAKRLLFIAHKDAILSQGLDTFKKVFQSTRTYGLYTGEKKELEADFIFATNSMMAMHLSDFKKDEFDYIILDECHHAVASTYQKILNYFEPSFTLGLTATPERMDDGDIYSLFDNNVPYDLRLRDALLNNLVVPFHYYGVKADGLDYSSKADIHQITSQIASNYNCELIADEINKYRPQGKLKALAFCASIEHAKEMAMRMKLKGFNTCYLYGQSDLGERLKAFKKLQDENDPLEIIFTVDILNEGVDVPSVNMVLFLRPTESSTIFIQQLGRGLRKYPGKEYVTILDFIGNNYDRSTQIALALGSLGSTTYMEKAYLREMVQSDFKSLNIPGVNIYLDEFSKEEILKQLDKVNFNKESYLSRDYEAFKKELRLNRPPKMLDYLFNPNAPDLMRFLKAKIKGTKNFSYYSFLRKVGEKELPLLTTEEEKYLNLISDYLPLTRPDEYLILYALLTDQKDYEDLEKKTIEKTLKHAQAMLIKDKVLDIDGSLMMKDVGVTLKELLLETINYGLTRFREDFSDYESLEFSLYHNYYKEQVMMNLLEQGKMFLKGTKFYSDGSTYVFVGLKKDKRDEEKRNYKDLFLSPSLFQWESENGVTKNSEIGQKIYKTKVVHLFIRKMTEEDGVTLPFTYFGTGHFTNIRPAKNGNENTLLMDVILDHEVPSKYHLDFNIPEENS